MASIDIVQVTKTFEKTTVIQDLSLTIRDGSFTVLVGPSGCGKTTLLRMIAGLDPQTSGSVIIGGTDVSRRPPGQRGVAMVFQNYALYPTMTVRENIEFGLKNNKVGKAERKALVETISETVGLQPYLDRKPATLSGGQRQRVALARAMVKKPSVFLMDEPLSNLDAKLRAQMRLELIELHKKLGTTFVYVTHDQVEAMSMADTIVLMNRGMIQQEASPEEMYRRPSNLFTAQFIGVPPMNVNGLGEGGIAFGFRPEHAILSLYPVAADFRAEGTIVTREMLGSETLYQIREQGRSYMVKSMDDSFAVGQQVHLGVGAGRLYFFDRDGRRMDEGHPEHRACLGMLRGHAHA
ncbi:ABC transporter [Paenibacillus mucilaginosus 3016]|uniref:ABC transporter n=1 Tax=Paenibacillus mucilaginosus 3016 TaxID=1116391 RepID=H6NEH9_9BACL|nr:ABC transporter ATP-binding protein [Paenibacillus mucilaginosus]AFC28122.1 ABC transporter [Paenibacillus mucilaginosus 3016]WFA16966.1 ABC transporter ATP-binding protein [Paenibacillus mucilaginosus]